MPDDVSGGTERSDHLHGDLITEYYKIADIVGTFDQRLMTVKSWGVTFAWQRWLSASSRSTTGSPSWRPRPPSRAGSSRLQSSCIRCGITPGWVTSR